MVVTTRPLPLMKTAPLARSSLKRCFFPFPLIACLLSLPFSSSRSATFTWDASGGGSLDDGAGSWNPTGGTNWFDGATFGAWPNTTSDLATFGAGAGTAGAVSVGNVTANALTFAAPGAGNYTLAGGTINLGGTTPTITTNSGTGPAISSTIAGSAGLRKSGAGVLYLSGNNTYSGTTSWSGTAGELVLASDSALGTSTISLGNATGTLSSTGALGGTRIITNTVTLNGAQVNLGSATNNDQLVLTSNFSTAGGPPAWFVTSNTTLSGTISGTNQLRTSSGIGILTLTGNNSGFTGGVRLDAGTLMVGNSNAIGSSGLIRLSGGVFKYGAGVANDYSSRLDFATTNFLGIDTSENNVTFSTALTPAASATALTKYGQGTLTLNSSSASTFAGNVTVNGGTLLLDFSNMATPTNILNPAQALTLQGGTLRIKGNPTGTTSQSFNTPAFNLSSSVATVSGITIDNNGGAGTTLTLVNNFNRGLGNTLNVDLSAGGTINTTVSAATRPYITVKDSTGTGFGRTTGTQLVRLTGQTTLAANSNSTADFITSGSLTMNSGSKQVGTLTLDASSSSGALDIGTGTLTFANGGLLLMGNNNYSVTNGQITSSLASAENIIHTMGSGTLTLGATVGGAGTITKSGPGTLLITGSNSYSGGTRLVQGTIATDNASAFGPGTIFVGGDSKLRFDANLTLSNSVTIDGRGLTLGNVRTNRYLTVDTNGNDTTLSGAIGGGGGIIKTGSGVLTLSGTNTYSGGTTISAGTLAISSNSNLGDSKYTPLSVNGGTLRIAGTALNNLNTRTVNWDSFHGGLDIAHASNTFTVANNISGSGSFTKSGAGTLTLTGINTHTGSTTVSAGTLLISTGSMNSTSQINLTGGVFNYGSSTGLNRNVTINGGNFKYNSASAYTGTLTLTSGTVSGSGNLGTTPLTIGSGVALAPGNSPGAISSGAQTWTSLGTYQWEINKVASAGGTRGGDPGWDWANITGNLNITATSGSKFTIDLVGLNPSTNTAGAIGGFDNTQNYSWTIATFSGAVSGFDPSVFNLDTTNFTNNNLIGSGVFGIEQVGNNVNLTFTAVPEPSSGSFLIAGFAAIPLTRRFRAKRVGIK